MVLPSITIIGDYGYGDLAFLEVIQRLQLELPHSQINTLSVSAFNTLGTGFALAQLALNPGLPERLYYHNCAPRKDNAAARLDNEGEELTFALLPNDVKVVGVFSAYTLSFLKGETKALHYLNVNKSGSQFRSRDVFPSALGAIAKGDYSLLGSEISLDSIPDVPENCISWVDGYGNLKTTIESHTLELKPGTKLTVNLGNVLAEATFTDGSFNVPEGVLAFSPGSSGWLTATGARRTWMELFLRGGSAYELFGKPESSQTLSFAKVKSHTNLPLELHTA